MRPFDLQEYIKNPTRPIVTRDGRRVRIICTNRMDNDYPLIVLIRKGNKEVVDCCTKDGKYIPNQNFNLDLFFAQEKKEGWINLYKDGNKTVIGNVYPLESEELAKEEMSDKNYIATCKIEWKE